MIKKIAWDAFKNTGDINTYLEFCQIKNMEENLNNLDIGLASKNSPKITPKDN